MRAFSTSLLILIIFVFLYVVCICAYTFLNGLNNFSNLEKGIHPPNDAFTRFRRSATDKNHITFNVCCDPDQYLNDKLECVTNVNATKDKAAFLSRIAVVDDSLIKVYWKFDTVLLKYGVKELCPKDEIEVIRWPDGEAHFHYISDSGYLLELSDDRKEVVSNYSNASFCLDVMDGYNKFQVALLCPCTEAVCIQKCCPRGFYYNIISTQCQNQSDDRIDSYSPHFPKGIKYHLTTNIPNCTSPDKLIVSENEFMPFDILENGQMLTLSNDNGILDRKQYCVDTFSTGDNNYSYVNGFYCPYETRIITISTEAETSTSEAAKEIKMMQQKILEAISCSSRIFVNIRLFSLVLYLLYFIYL